MREITVRFVGTELNESESVGARKVYSRNDLMSALVAASSLTETILTFL